MRTERVQRRGEGGQTLIIAALIMAVVMGFTAMAVDLGLMFEDRRHLQGGPPRSGGEFVITGLGIGRHHPRDFAPLLEALRGLPRVRLRLVGSAFSGLAGDRVEVLPTVPYREMLGVLGASDASLLLLGAGADSRLSMPTALFDYLLAGKPILALATEGYPAALVRASGLGRVVPPGDRAGITAALQGMLEARELPVPDPEALRTYDRSEQAKRFVELLDQGLRDRDKRAQP